MSVNELSLVQFRQVTSVLASINLLSDYVAESVRPKWYFEQSDLDDAQRAALTELMNDSPVMPELTLDDRTRPIMVNLADPSGYMPRESGLVTVDTRGDLTLSVGDPAEFMDSQQISAFNTFIRRLKNRSELVARNGSAFSSVAITFEEGTDAIKNTVVEFKNDQGETVFVADGDTPSGVKDNMPDSFLYEMNEFIAQTMMTSTEDLTLFEELLGFPTENKPAPTQEAHPQWGTW